MFFKPTGIREVLLYTNACLYVLIISLELVALFASENWLLKKIHMRHTYFSLSPKSFLNWVLYATIIHSKVSKTNIYSPQFPIKYKCTYLLNQHFHF